MNLDHLIFFRNNKQFLLPEFQVENNLSYDRKKAFDNNIQENYLPSSAIGIEILIYPKFAKNRVILSFNIFQPQNLNDKHQYFSALKIMTIFCN